MPRRVLLGALALGLTACTYPVSETTQGGQSSAIYFEAFPLNAAVSVNGVVVGVIADFDGAQKTFAVPEGTNTILVRDGQRTLFDKRVFVGRNSTQKISG